MSDFEVIKTEDVLCFTPKQVMEILGCSKSEVYVIFHRNDFPSFRISKKKLAVRRVDFFKWQEDKKEEFKKEEKKNGNSNINCTSR